MSLAEILEAALGGLDMQQMKAVATNRRSTVSNASRFGSNVVDRSMTTTLPTAAEFRKLVSPTPMETRRVDDVLRALDAACRAPQGASGIPAARDLRRACVTWMLQPENKAGVGPFHEHMNDLLRRANQRYKDIVEANPNAAATVAATTVPPIPPLPTLATPAGTVTRIGNTMRDKYVDEMASPHWTPKVNTEITQAYDRYRGRGGRLDRAQFARLVLGPSLHDDPTSYLLREGEVLDQPGSGSWSPSGRTDARAVLYGIRYLSNVERPAFQVHIRKGVLYHHDIVSSRPSLKRFDTKNKRVSDYDYGWGMFVLGFDNALYVEAEARDYFHHSSFFAGGPVQCAGELCCIDGTLRYITAKAGHYRSGRREFYQILKFLSYHEVDLTTILVATDPKDRPYKWFTASEVYNTPADVVLVPRKVGLPSVLHEPGTPTIVAAKAG